jgi:hypothetical protein
MPLDSRLYRSPNGDIARLEACRVSGPGGEQWWSVSLVRADGRVGPVEGQPALRVVLDAGGGAEA